MCSTRTLGLLKKSRVFDKDIEAPGKSVCVQQAEQRSWKYGQGGKTEQIFDFYVSLQSGKTDHFESRYLSPRL